VRRCLHLVRPCEGLLHPLEDSRSVSRTLTAWPSAADDESGIAHFPRIRVCAVSTAVTNRSSPSLAQRSIHWHSAVALPARAAHPRARQQVLDTRGEARPVARRRQPLPVALPTVFIPNTRLPDNLRKARGTISRAPALFPRLLRDACRTAELPSAHSQLARQQTRWAGCDLRLSVACCGSRPGCGSFRLSGF
jgi:hypothetical protein